MGFLAPVLPAIGSAIGGLFGSHSGKPAGDIQKNQAELIAEMLNRAQLSDQFGSNQLMPLFQQQAQATPNYISSVTPYMQNAAGSVGTGQWYAANADPFINQSQNYINSINQDKAAARNYVSSVTADRNAASSYISGANPFIAQSQNFINSATPILHKAEGMINAASPDFSGAENYVHSVDPMLQKSQGFINDISPLANQLHDFISQRMDLGSPYYAQHQYESANAIDQNFNDLTAQLMQQLNSRQNGVANTGTAAASMGQMAQQQASSLSEGYLQNLFQNENLQMQAAGMMPLVSGMRQTQAQLEQSNAQIGLGQAGAMTNIGQARTGQGSAYGNLAQIPLGQSAQEQGLGQLRLGQANAQLGVGQLGLGQANASIGIGQLGAEQASREAALGSLRLGQANAFMTGGNTLAGIGSLGLGQANANTNYLNAVNPLPAWGNLPVQTGTPGQLSSPAGLGLGNLVGQLGNINWGRTSSPVDVPPGMIGI